MQYHTQNYSDIGLRINRNGVCMNSLKKIKGSYFYDTVPCHQEQRRNMLKKKNLSKNQAESLQTITGLRHELLESATPLTHTYKQTLPGQVTTVRSHLGLQSVS